MRTVLRVFLGFIVAILAAAAIEVLFAHPPTGWAEQEGETVASQMLALGVLTLKAATHTAIFSALFALIVIVIGEWLHLRSWFFYTATGAVIAFGGFLAQYAAEQASWPTIVNTYALVAFITAGAVGGWVYWFVAGRNAGRRCKPATRSVKDKSNSREIPASEADQTSGEALKRSAEAASPGRVVDESRDDVSQAADLASGNATSEGGTNAKASSTSSVPDAGSGRSRIYVAARTVPDSGGGNS